MMPTRKFQARSEPVRNAIIKAAQTCFAEANYHEVTIREIAARAGCNSSMIARYYGSKEALFRRAIADEIPPIQVANAAELIDYMLDGIGAGYDGIRADVAAAIFRSSSLSPVDKIIKAAVEQRFIALVRRHVIGPDAAVRAEIFTAIMHGLNVYRNLIRTDALSEAATDQFKAILTPLVTRLLTPSEPGSTTTSP